MSTENDNLPNDEQLSSLYKQAGQDMPPAHLDDAILAAARRETASRPRRALGPFSYTWRVPASLAAVLVISFAIVTLMENDLTPLDSIATTTMSEAEMFQAPLEPIAESVTAEEKRETAMTPGKPAMRTLAKRDKRPPAVKSPPVASADTSDMEIQQGLSAKQAQDKQRREQVARKKKQTSSVEKATDKLLSATTVPALARLDTPVATLDAITALRLSGNQQQAKQAADAYILHHFGEDLDTLAPNQVMLSIEEWEKFIVELRNLERNQQADKLAWLLNRRLNQLTPIE